MNLESFLQSKTGKMFMKVAEREAQKLDERLASESEKLTQMKAFQRFSQYGDYQNDKIIDTIDGVPVYMETDNLSRVTKAVELTPEVFNTLDAQEKQSIKQAQPVLYQRLVNNDMPQTSKSDKFYQLISQEGMRAELMLELGTDYDAVYGQDAWKHFSSGDHRTNGVSKRAEFLQQAFDVNNISQVAKDIYHQEKLLTDMAETSDYNLQVGSGEIPSAFDTLQKMAQGGGSNE
ncbi:hypothetical protein [Bacillus albus]|uniref:Uncharacterized protein n=1 Tax=Bacillus albus TaxID=2026189 RepID=A0A1J9UXL8_9BACI|nr:hypothetical protein [Bacillus albus]OJD68943.1 hypothetical protein BAU25_05065 [Bacillus albus]WJE70009.1 hypothetical protein QRY64_25295 [Bacillus albus]